MKTLFVSTGLALMLAAPAFAGKPPAPAPAPVEAQPAEAQPVDIQPADDISHLIELGTTSEDRVRMMLRCGGPPAPRFPDRVAAARQPASEPAVTPAG